MIGLEGAISEFNIVDVLQLICQQQKSGVLTVEHKGQKAELYIEEGRIVSAGPTKYNLGELLIRAKLLSPGDLQRALDKQQETYEQLGEILIKQGSAEAADLERAINNQIYETLYDVCPWKEGTYKFNPKQTTRVSSFLKPMNFQSVLLDVLRMIDEWPEVNSFIPSFDIRFQKILDVNTENLQAAALLVYNLINGTRTVQEIIDESLLGRFNTCKILSEFLQAGYISRASFTPAAPRKSRMSMYYKKVLAACHYAILSAILLALAALIFTAPQNILPILSPSLMKRSYLAEYLNNTRLFKIDNALEIYKIRHGVYPGSLQELITGGILNPADLTMPGEKIITYLPENNSYNIKFERRSK
jgi:hypothetical protein